MEISMDKKKGDPLFIYDQKLFNVIYLGLCFLTNSAASSTITNLQKVIVTSIHEDNPTYNGDGYIGLGISCSFTAVSLWLSPSFLAVIGSKNALVIGAVGELLFSASFYLENTLVYYITSAVAGVTHALLWTGQGVYLIANSTPKTVVRDSAIFWFLYHISPILGNISAFFPLAGKSTVDISTRMIILDILNLVLVLSVIMFCFLPPSDKTNSNEQKTENCAEALREAWNVFSNRHMIVLMVLFIYSGLQIAYSETIYNSSVGFSLSLSDNAKELVPLTGIFNGIGILLGVCIQALQKVKHFRWRNYVYLTIGIQCQLLCYCLTGLNLPDKAAFGDTYRMGILFNSVSVALLSSILLGIGNMAIQTYVSGLIATLFWDKSSQVVAVFNFTEFVSSAICFVYSAQIGLHAQLIILIVTAVFGNVAYLLVELSIDSSNQIKFEETPVQSSLYLDRKSSNDKNNNTDKCNQFQNGFKESCKIVNEQLVIKKPLE